MRMESLHDLLFAIDAFEIAEPGIARAELWARLLEDETSLGSRDAQDLIGDSAGKLLDDGGRGDRAAFKQIFVRVGNRQFEHANILSHESAAVDVEDRAGHEA